MKKTLFGCLVLLAMVLNAWQTPVLIEKKPDCYYGFTQVRFDSLNMAYILYTSGNDVMFARYDGEKVTVIGELGESAMVSFTPWMFIDASDTVHMVWAEATSRISRTYFLRYRSYDGREFSEISTLIELDIPGNTLHYSKPPKTDPLRMVMDKNGNMFIVYMDATKYKSRFISKYGDTVTFENFPMNGKSKFPDLAVDDDHVHVTWQAGLGTNNPDGGYTVFWGQRENKVDGKWLPEIDIKEGQNWSNSAHWPLITLDKNNHAHFLWQDDGDPRARVCWYKYWNGSVFEPRVNISGTNPQYWSNNSLRVKDEDNVFISGHCRPGSIYSAWKINGAWSDYQPLPYVSELLPDSECADVSKDFKTAVVTFSSGYAAAYLVASSRFKANQRPVAVIDADKDTIFWKDSVSFDAGRSSDPDGSIVKYEWDFGDGVKSETSTPTATHPYDTQYGNLTVSLQVVDNKNSISFPVAKTIEVKALFTPINITFQKKRIRTLVYNRWGYAVSWQANPKNAGYNIVKYRVFRKAVSMEGDYIAIADVDTAKNSYLDLSIEQSTDYEYVVCAVDAEGHISPSNNFD